jgi:hypothetical protein
MVTERKVSIKVGIVVERREIDNRWQKFAWRPVEVIAGAPDFDGVTVLRQGDGWVHYLAATLPLELHRRETEAYKVNLSNAPPSVYVVLRELDDATELDYKPFVATVSPYEAQDYLDSGEEIVERVPMEEGMIAWVQAFIDRHHVDEPFYKRKRKRYDPDEVGFGRRPVDETRKRREGESG